MRTATHGVEHASRRSFNGGGSEGTERSPIITDDVELSRQALQGGELPCPVSTLPTASAIAKSPIWMRAPLKRWLEFSTSKVLPS
jgi:hypothetical protein